MWRASRARYDGRIGISKGPHDFPSHRRHIRFDAELSKKWNRLSSDCDSVVVVQHSSEALAALYRLMG